jgi:hypothetical protein
MIFNAVNKISQPFMLVRWELDSVKQLTKMDTGQAGMTIFWYLLPG